MADRENYWVAIDILCCHLGMSFDEACSELGLTEQQIPQQREDFVETKESVFTIMPEK